MYQSIYGLPFGATVLLTLGLCLIWFGARALMQEQPGRARCFRALNVLLLLAWAAVVTYETVLSREQGNYNVWLRPFYQIERLRNGGNPEIIRVLWMNTLLFVPCGVLLPDLFPRRWRALARAALAPVFGCLLSCAIEGAQWYFRLGVTEIDDVIFNTLGVLIGSLLYLLFTALIGCLQRHTDA